MKKVLLFLALLIFGCGGGQAAALIMAPGSAHAQPIGWDFYFFGVNTKTFKEADWKMVALGAATSVAVHTAGHYAYAYAHGMNIKQDGFCEAIQERYPDQRMREFSQAGFVAQHLVGVILTTIPKTRQTDFTRGYVAFSWAQTATYPLFFNNNQGDLNVSHRYGSDRDLEYLAYMAVATHNILRVNWSK